MLTEEKRTMGTPDQVVDAAVVRYVDDAEFRVRVLRTVRVIEAARSAYGREAREAALLAAAVALNTVDVAIDAAIDRVGR